MVTFNGRITLPYNVRKELGLKTGDSVDFVEIEKGRFAIRCSGQSLRGLDPSAAANEMDKAVQ
jgi:AbrB family looped-hinge helix DNA binding protein